MTTTGQQIRFRALMGPALIVFSLADAAASLAEDAADLVLHNGRFYSVADAGVVEGSLAIRAGRIVFLGSSREASEFVGPRTRELELGGRAVTPGWIDAHSHLVSLGRSLEEVDLVGTASYAEVIERVEGAAASVPKGTWVQGRGWDQNDWAAKAFPTHQLLSRAVPDHPVWLRRIDGHAALLNEKAIEMLGVDKAATDPVGGSFVKETSGELTGVLIDTAMSVGGSRPGPTQSDVTRWIEKGGEYCLERGLTTVTEMGIDSAELQAYANLRDRDEMPLRVEIFLSDQPELLDSWFESGPRLDTDHWLEVRGIKMYADGALGSRGAALIEPYDDAEGNLGLLRVGSGHVASVCERALGSGFQVGIHAIGDRGALVALDGYERCFGRPRPEARFRIEHAQVMRLADIHRMAGLGIVASMQPTHATSDMPWAEARVGPERIQGAYSWRKILDQKGRLALGSDFPVERVSPLLGFYAAVTRQDLDGRPADGWYAGERLSREEALRGFTLDAAYSLFLENELGSLEVGKRADLVVFERDPMTVDVAEIPSIAVDYTILSGTIAYGRERSP